MRRIWPRCRLSGRDRGTTPSFRENIAPRRQLSGGRLSQTRRKLRGAKEIESRRKLSGGRFCAIRGKIGPWDNLQEEVRAINLQEEDRAINLQEEDRAMGIIFRRKILAILGKKIGSRWQSLGGRSGHVDNLQKDDQTTTTTPTFCGRSGHE